MLSLKIVTKNNRSKKFISDGRSNFLNQFCTLKNGACQILLRQTKISETVSQYIVYHFAFIYFSKKKHVYKRT